nr:hypothetical protein TetV2_00049 [Oceanusvirus sp.]
MAPTKFNRASEQGKKNQASLRDLQYENARRNSGGPLLDVYSDDFWQNVSDHIDHHSQELDIENREAYLAMMTHLVMGVVARLLPRNNILGVQVKGARFDAVNIVVFFPDSHTERYTYRTFDARIEGTRIEFGKNKATIYPVKGENVSFRGRDAHHIARQIATQRFALDYPVPGQLLPVTSEVLEKMYPKVNPVVEKEFNSHFKYRLADSYLYDHVMSLLDQLTSGPEGLGGGAPLPIRSPRRAQLIEDAIDALHYAAVIDSDLMYWADALWTELYGAKEVYTLADFWQTIIDGRKTLHRIHLYKVALEREKRAEEMRRRLAAVQSLCLAIGTVI